MKILIGTFGTESNAFTSDKGTMERFMPQGIPCGREIFDVYRGTVSFMGGIIKAGEEEGVELIPSIAAIESAPVLERDVVDEAVGQLCAFIGEHRDEIDGICLGMHGAGVGAGIPDLESFTLSAVREAMGRYVPVMSSMDLHGNISEESCVLSDGLFGTKHYPHIDEYDMGYKTMKVLIGTVRGEIKPELAVRRLPLLIAPAIGCTLRSPMKEVREHVEKYAEENGLIDATFFHGFPYSDVPCEGACVTVVSEKDAQRHADALAEWIWKRREELVPECLSCEEALDRAEEELSKPGDGYVIINDTSDNPGGGTPGDGTYLLKEFLRRNEPGMLFGHITDREFVDLAFRAGVGGKVSGLLGGKTDNLHGEPIEIRDAEVLDLSDRKCLYKSPMLTGIWTNLGRLTRVRAGNVEIVVNEIPGSQVMDDCPYELTGADVNAYSIIGLKSSTHFRAWFEGRAKAIVTADPPGSHTSNLKQLNFTSISRPIYPLDPDTEFCI